MSKPSTSRDEGLNKKTQTTPAPLPCGLLPNSTSTIVKKQHTRKAYLCVVGWVVNKLFWWSFFFFFSCKYLAWVVPARTFFKTRQGPTFFFFFLFVSTRVTSRSEPRRFSLARPKKTFFMAIELRTTAPVAARAVGVRIGFDKARATGPKKKLTGGHSQTDRKKGGTSSRPSQRSLASHNLQFLQTSHAPPLPVHTHARPSNRAKQL